MPSAIPRNVGVATREGERRRGDRRFAAAGVRFHLAPNDQTPYSRSVEFGFTVFAGSRSTQSLLRMFRSRLPDRSPVVEYFEFKYFT